MKDVFTWYLFKMLSHLGMDPQRSHLQNTVLLFTPFTVDDEGTVHDNNSNL